MQTGEQQCVLFLVPMDQWFLKVFHSPYHTPSNIAHKPSLPVEVPRPQVPRFCRHLLVELWGNVVIVINLAVVSQTPEVGSIFSKETRWNVGELRQRIVGRCKGSEFPLDVAPGGGGVVQGRGGQRHQVHCGGEAAGPLVIWPQRAVSPQLRGAQRAQTHVGEVGGRQLQQAAVRGRAVVLQRRLGIEMLDIGSNFKLM